MLSDKHPLAKCDCDNSVLWMVDDFLGEFSISAYLGGKVHDNDDNCVAISIPLVAYRAMEGDNENGYIETVVNKIDDILMPLGWDECSELTNDTTRVICYHRPDYANLNCDCLL